MSCAALVLKLVLVLVPVMMVNLVMLDAMDMAACSISSFCRSTRRLPSLLACPFSFSPVPPVPISNSCHHYFMGAERGDARQERLTATAVSGSLAMEAAERESNNTRVGRPVCTSNTN